MQVKTLHRRSQVILMILILSPYLFLKNLIFRHEFVHEFMSEFMHEFVDEFFANFVYEFKYEICTNSCEFFARKIGYVTNGLYCFNFYSRGESWLPPPPAPSLCLVIRQRWWLESEELFHIHMHQGYDEPMTTK